MRTLFVIGAGASADFGLPVGSQLMAQIRALFDLHTTSDNSLGYEIDRIAQPWQDAGVPHQRQFAILDWMCRTLPLANSIDDFLEKHSQLGDGLSFIGKYAIATLISKAESESPLYHRMGYSPDFESLSETWLGRLFPLINRGGAANIDEKGLDHVSFLTFNYDRCIEQFLFFAFREFYRISDDEAVNLVESVDIHHAYGQLGHFRGRSGELAFGQSHFGPSRINAISSIKTYSEQLEDLDRNRVQEMINRADRIVFVGFGFLPINQKLLFPEIPDVISLKQVLGTSLGLSPSDKKRAEEWCNSAFRRGHPGAELDPVRGGEFFSQNRLLFT
jgi:hypothetical protein